MHKIHRWAVRCVAATSLILALPASAYLQFTYTSQQLPLASYLIEDYPQDISEIPMSPPAFSLSFTTSEPGLARAASTTLLIENFTFSLLSPDADYIHYPTFISPSSYGRIELDQDGKVAGWDFLLQMTELITPETNMLFYEMHDHHVTVRSNSDTGDQLGLRFHPITWHGQWIQLVQLDITFADEQNRGSWTVEKMAVPEPGMGGLLLGGLAALLWSRRTNRRSIRQEKICLKSAN